jgi:signal transduction histidine kinase
MGDRGTLSVTSRIRKGRSLPWKGDKAAPQWVELVVKDTGPGISPKILNNLFVPFFSTKSKGTGLGLAISQRIVQSAGGTIEVSSQLGSGSTFTVVLPANTAEDPSHEARSERKRTGPEPLTSSLKV